MSRKRDKFEDREVDRKYIKFKMKRIKRAKKRGNNAAARRHATELIQFLGLDGESELPIEAMIEVLQQEGNAKIPGKYTSRFQKLRGSVSPRYDDE